MCVERLSVLRRVALYSTRILYRWDIGDLSVQFFPTMTARLTVSSLLSLPQIDTKWNKIKDLEDP